ncbi:unnamed protein product, partial [marine sediment metagenome]
SYMNLGCCYFYEGYLNKAEHEYLKALKKCQKFGIEADLVWVYRFYGTLLIFKKKYKMANEYINNGIKLARELNMFFGRLKIDKDGLNSSPITEAYFKNCISLLENLSNLAFIVSVIVSGMLIREYDSITVHFLSLLLK